MSAPSPTNSAATDENISNEPEQGKHQRGDSVNQLEQRAKKKFTPGRKYVKQHVSKSKKHKKIDKNHPEFELTYDMMLGIRTTVSQVQSKPSRDLKVNDFKESIRLRMLSEGTPLTPAHEMRDFKFKDYAPEVFRRLRERFGINPADYLLCVCGNFQYLEFIANSKSGQFFFYTHNRQFMIKTITQEESQFLRDILPAYYQHVMDNPNTLLTRFYGMHRVKPHKKPEKHFLILASVFHTNLYIHTTFDLKGSTQGREASESEKMKTNAVLKDNDFIERGSKIRIGPDRKAQLMEQLTKDVEFLCQRNIMDYSLLLGIHDGSKLSPRRTKKHRTASLSSEMREEDQLDRQYTYTDNGTETQNTFTETGLDRQYTATYTGRKDTEGNDIVTVVHNPPSGVGPENADSAQATQDAQATDGATSSSAPVDQEVKTSDVNIVVTEPPPSTTEPQQSSSSTATTLDGVTDEKSSAPVTRQHSAGSTSSTVTTMNGSPKMSVHVVQPLEVDSKDTEEKRRQSNYGLPLRYDQQAKPGEFHFTAPEFPHSDSKALAAAEFNAAVKPVIPLFTRDDGGVRGMRDDKFTDDVYYMGIIDILQTYNTRKRLEHVAKSLRYNSLSISAVHPKLYKNRFLDFLDKHIE